LGTLSHGPHRDRQEHHQEVPCASKTCPSLNSSAGGRAAQVFETGSPTIPLSWACFRIEMVFASLREGSQMANGVHDSIHVALQICKFAANEAKVAEVAKRCKCSYGLA
jgi:hypothetical protein